MKSTTATLLATLLTLAPVSLTHPTLPLLPRTTSTAACNNASLHIIIARASTETAANGGEGVTGIMASAIEAQISGATSEGITYPATLLDYVNSETQGITSLTGVVTDYATRCPGAKFALMGYSQGAQVVGDVLCGRSSTGASNTDPISTTLTKDLVSIIKMGDPTHVVGQVGNKGTSTNNGLFARQNLTPCEPYGSLTNSWCDSTDEFCDSGLSLTTHLSYFDHETDIVNWVVSGYNAAK